MQQKKDLNLKMLQKQMYFQAKARLAGATSKRIEAENNLKFQFLILKLLSGRKPNINWFESDKTKVIQSNPKDWSKFGEFLKIPESLE